MAWRIKAPNKTAKFSLPANTAVIFNSTQHLRQSTESLTMHSTRTVIVYMALQMAHAIAINAAPDLALNPQHDAVHELFIRDDKYPYAGNCGVNKADKWDFIRCSCTSYVAWRINEDDKDLDFDNHYKGEQWSDAKNWDNVARKVGVKINSTPKVGAIAQTDDGPGHVAYVTKVSKDKKKISVEEYNFEHHHEFGRRSGLEASRFRYIHL